ncbi:MAG: hypothetical protein KDC49_17240 [Saprospiraceae bacterium]|nr:hypothetical protein [Saprospiraceae bacterium]
MKKSMILLFTFLAMFSCKKDEDTCAASDFVGVYSGTFTCPGEDDQTSMFELKLDGGKLVLEDDEGEQYNLQQDDCDFTIPIVNFGLGSYNGKGNLNGNELTLEITVSALGETQTCTFKGSKQ